MPESTSIIYVSSSEELLQALQTATGGETISLQSGDYGDVVFSNLHFTSTVTITSDVALGAKFNSIVIKSSDYLRIDGIEVEKILTPDDPTHLRAIDISNSSYIEILNSDLHGSIDGDYNNDGHGVNVNLSSNITFSGNDFHDLKRGVVVTNSEDISLINNEVFDIRSDGFDFAGVTNITIEGNNFTNFYPNLELGDHADGIQFWNTGVENESGNVVISNNTFLQGEGEGFQSIFIESDIPDMGYYNFTITDNLIYNGSPHGITVTDGRDITVSNNTVLEFPESNYTPQILISRPTGTVEVSNNASALSLADSPFITSTNNIEVQNTDSTLPTYYGNLFFDALSGASSELEDFIPKPGSLLDSDLRIGAFDYSATTETLQAHASVQTNAGTAEGLTATFDAQYTSDVDGNTTATNATYHWDYGDGTTGEGIVSVHTYASEGDYTATLTVTRDGKSDSTTHTLSVTDPHIMDIADAGDLDASLLLANMSADDTSLNFDGTGYLNFGRPNDMFGLDEMYLSFDISMTDIPSGKSRIFWNHSRYTVELNGDDLYFMVYTDGGTPNKIVINNVDIFDGQFHNIAMSFDGENGTIKAFIDNVEVGALTGVVGSIDGVGSWDVTVGGTPWGNNFNGQMQNLDVWSAIAPVETNVIIEEPVDPAEAEALAAAEAEALAAAEAEALAAAEAEALAAAEAEALAAAEAEALAAAEAEALAAAEAEALAAAEAEALAAAEAEALAAAEAEPIEIISIKGAEDATDYTAYGNAKIGAESLQFNGKGYIDLGQESGMFGLDAFTLSLDVTASTGKNDNSGTVRLVWNPEHYGIEMRGEDVIFRIQTDTGDTQVLIAENVNINDGGTHNVALSYDSATGTMSAYIDDILVADATGITGSIGEASGDSITLGGSARGKTFNGEIDNFSLWNEANHLSNTTEIDPSLTIISEPLVAEPVESTDPSLSTEPSLDPDDPNYNPDGYLDPTTGDNILF